MRVQKRPVRVESTHLSTGQLMEITKIGRHYNFMLASTDDFTAPDLLLGLSKKDAYAAFETHLRADVLEVAQ